MQLQIDILKYHAHIFQKAVRCKFPNIFATYGNATALNIPKAGDQTGNRCLSTAGRPDYGGHSSLRNGKADIIKNFRSLFVGEANMIKDNIIML